MDHIRAKKSLGQNFLQDENVLKKIANSFSLTEHDLIIEIGPGKGALTKYLVKKNTDLICYEIDERMKNVLFPYQSERTKIIFDDFLKRDIKEDIQKEYAHIYVIANIPYYITTPIIEHIIESDVLISGMCFLVQKEVAERLCALPKSREYGYFTVYLQCFYQVEKLFDVSPQCFNPAPKVWSSVILLTKKRNENDISIKEFQSFLKDAFFHKRKTLKNNLSSYDWTIISSFLQENNKPLTLRAEELSYQEFVSLFHKIKEAS